MPYPISEAHQAFLLYSFLLVFWIWPYAALSSIHVILK